jgi:opacity protein-like surface antigen
MALINVIIKEKKYMKLVLNTIMLFLFCVTPFQAQEAVQEKEIKHNVSFVFGFTHIPQTLEEGEPLNSQNIPTIGVDYFYHFNQKWRLGAVVDVELGKYEVDFNDENLKRETAVVTGVMAGYRILKGWSILAGPGVEFERNKNLFILRLSTEYEFELGKNWGLFPSFSYDFKKEYGTYSLGIGVSKGF